MEVIRNVVQNTKHDVSFNVEGFIKVKKQSGYNYSSIVIFLIIFALLYVINSEEDEF